MGTTQDTVFLSQDQLDNLLQTLHEKDASSQAAGSAFRPVGRIDYDKRKYRDMASRYRFENAEIL